MDASSVDDGHLLSDESCDLDELLRDDDDLPASPEGLQGAEDDDHAQTAVEDSEEQCDVEQRRTAEAPTATAVPEPPTGPQQRTDLPRRLPWPLPPAEREIGATLILRSHDSCVAANKALLLLDAPKCDLQVVDIKELRELHDLYGLDVDVDPIDDPRLRPSCVLRDRGKPIGILFGALEASLPVKEKSKVKDVRCFAGIAQIGAGKMPIMKGHAISTPITSGAAYLVTVVLCQQASQQRQTAVVWDDEKSELTQCGLCHISGVYRDGEPVPAAEDVLYKISAALQHYELCNPKNACDRSRYATEVAARGGGRRGGMGRGRGSTEKGGRGGLDKPAPARAKGGAGRGMKDAANGSNGSNSSKHGMGKSPSHHQAHTRAPVGKPKNIAVDIMSEDESGDEATRSRKRGRSQPAPMSQSAKEPLSTTQAMVAACVQKMVQPLRQQLEDRDRKISLLEEEVQEFLRKREKEQEQWSRQQQEGLAASAGPAREKEQERWSEVRLAASAGRPREKERERWSPQQQETLSAPSYGPPPTARAAPQDSNGAGEVLEVPMWGGWRRPTTSDIQREYSARLAELRAAEDYDVRCRAMERARMSALLEYGMR